MIYLVMYGFYSDWGIDGYFTNADDAYAYCEEKRRQGQDDYHVEVVREISAEYSGERPKIFYEYRFMCQEVLLKDLSKTEWRFLNTEDNGPDEFHLSTPSDVEKIYWKKPVTDYLGLRQITIVVKTEIPDFKRALKIAQDYFAWLRAEGKIED